MEQIQLILDRLSTDPWLRAGIILVFSFLSAFLIDQVVTRILKAITQKTKTTADDQLLALLHRPVQISVILLGFAVASYQLPLDADPKESVWQDLVINVLQTIAVLLWVVFSFRFSKVLLRALSKDTKRFQVLEPTTLPLFDNLAKVLLFGLGIYLVIQAWGKDVGALLASAGVMGVALGFAAKDTLANLFAGVFILADAPYRLNDFIVLDSGERGKVVHIGIRSTRLLTRDDIEITIPNAVMGAAKIMNETGGVNPKRRLRIPVGVAYGSNVDQVKEVLKDVAIKDPIICETPEPRVRFRNFGNSTLDFELLCWIPEPVLRGQATDALLTSVYNAFASDDIEIAFPQLDVHLHRAK
jgi:small-conductance mechanosensitive channel